MGVRFGAAAHAALELAEDYASSRDTDVVVIRDLLGRLSVALSGAADQHSVELADALRASCAPFVAMSPVLLLEGMLAPELILDAADRRPLPLAISPSQRVTMIDRGTVGADWLAPSEAPPSNRVTLYGFKGGVGRSTATYALAGALADAGAVVLVIDLDLESPGISTMLAPDPDFLPEHGLVDHLVEHAVGNADGLQLVGRSTALVPALGNGEVWLAAAHGRSGQGSEYLDKLNRVYLDVPAGASPGAKSMTFGARLEAAVASCEAQVRESGRSPDVVLLDSRSGIHDIAAVAITQLSSLSLLFATDDPQTWIGYRQMFERWSERLSASSRSSLRDRLQMVAALVPSFNQAEYLRSFADHAQACFAATLYDDEPGVEDGGESAELFNFAPDDESAPHYPLVVNHRAELVGLVPGIHTSWRESREAVFAYADFLGVATRMIGDLRGA